MLYFIVKDIYMFSGLGFVPSVRQNFDETVNAELRKQIHYELTASYVYEAYVSFTDRCGLHVMPFVMVTIDNFIQNRVMHVLYQ